MSRRKRTDSIEAQTSAMSRASNGPPSPPEFCHLPDECLPFWEAIMNTKDYEMWTPNDLVIAAGLARITMEIEQYSMTVLRSKRVMKEKDSWNVSPVHKVLNDLQAQQATLCRTLQIHARATHGESTFQKKRNQLFFDSRAITQESEFDELLAKAH